MASGRQPRNKGEDTKPEILRAVRLGDAGDVYGPGEEDEFLDALQTYVDQHNEAVEESGQPELDVNEELTRLTALGHIVNFEGVDVDDEDMEESDHDLSANRKAARSAAVETTDRTVTRARSPRKKAAAPAEEESE